MTGEDLFHLYLMDNEGMADYERKYTNISGNSFENEMAKIVLRYKNEGKPEFQNESKKQVRFEERGAATYDNRANGEQLRGDRI